MEKFNQDLSAGFPTPRPTISQSDDFRCGVVDTLATTVLLLASGQMDFNGVMHSVPATTDAEADTFSTICLPIYKQALDAGVEAYLEVIKETSGQAGELGEVGPALKSKFDEFLQHTLYVLKTMSNDSTERIRRSKEAGLYYGDAKAIGNALHERLCRSRNYFESLAAGKDVLPPDGEEVGYGQWLREALSKGIHVMAYFGSDLPDDDDIQS